MRIWHVFNALAAVNIVLLFTADDTVTRALHVLSAISFAIAAIATRPARPGNRP